MKKSITTSLLYLGIVLAGSFIAYKMIHIPKQAELVALVSLLLLYPIFRVPIFGLYTAFFVAPFIPFIRRLYYLVHGRPGIDPLIMVTDILVAVVFMGLFFEFRDRLRDKDSTGQGYLALVAAYLAYMVARSFLFTILPLSESLTKLNYYGPNVLLFFVGFIIANRGSQLKTLWKMTLIIGVAASAYGLNQLYIGYSTAEKIWFSTISFTTLFISGIARPFSFFQAPAAFADYLILAIIAALMLAEGGSRKAKIAAMLAIPVLFYGVLITSVRSGWIGAISVFFFWFAFVKVKKMSSRIILIAAVAGVFFSYQLVADMISTGIGIKNVTGLLSKASTSENYVDLLVTTRASALTNPFEEHSMMSRVTLWKYLLDSSLEPERALLGRGLGAMNADSLYVTYLAEFGYPGLLLIIFLILSFIALGLRSLDTLTDPWMINVAKGIVVMDMVFALMNITGTHIHSFPGDMYFWLFNGVLVNIHLIDKKRNEESGAA